MAKARLSDRPKRSFEDFEEKPAADKKQPVKEEEIENFASIPIIYVVEDKSIRKDYDEDSISELAESIKKYGLLQPIRVYVKNGQYVILFGHRRFLACKKIGLKQIKVIIVNEPDSLDRVYIQVIENEQNQTLSPEDREAYIKLLRDMGQSCEEIAKKIGKSLSWVNMCSVAFNVREKNQPLFNSTGLTLSTAENYALRNANEDQIKKAVELLVENPANKTEILECVNKNNIRKKNVGAKKKNNYLLLSLEKMEIKIEINLDKKTNYLSFINKNTSDLTQQEIDSLFEILRGIFQKRGYNFDNDKKD